MSAVALLLAMVVASCAGRGGRGDDRGRDRDDAGPRADSGPPADVDAGPLGDVDAGSAGDDAGTRDDAGTPRGDAGMAVPLPPVLWTATFGSMANVYDTVSRLWSDPILDVRPDSSLTGIEVDGRGGVFVGAGGGLYYATTPAALPELVVPASEVAVEYWAPMAVGRDDRIRIVTGGQLVVLSRDGTVTLDRTVPFSSAMGMAYRGDELWVTYAYTVWRVPPTGPAVEVVREPVMSGSVAMGLAVGADGRVYFGYPHEVRVIDPARSPAASETFFAWPGYYPQAIEAGPGGRIYVAGGNFEARTSSVEVLTVRGELEESYGTGDGLGTARDIELPP